MPSQKNLNLYLLSYQPFSITSIPIVTLFTIFQLIFSQNNCSKYINCYECKMCGDINNSICDCDWDSELNNCTNSSTRTLKNWYDEVYDCDYDPIYCGSRGKNTYAPSDLKDNKIIFELSPDNNNKYGSYFTYCIFDYYDEKENSYDVSIKFAKNISNYNKPLVAFASIYLYKGNPKGTMLSVQKDFEISYRQIYNIYFMILLMDEYNLSPVTFTLKNSESQTNLLTSLILAGIIIIIVLVATCFIMRYINRKKREQMLLVQRQTNANDNSEELIKNKNKEKLKELFETVMKEHNYKIEYNTFNQDSCTICLEKFNSESKVSVTQCNHIFHFKCLYDWLFGTNLLCPKCPNCNNEILKEKKNNEVNTKIIQVNRNVVNNNENNLENNTHVGNNSSVFGIARDNNDQTNRRMLGGHENSKRDDENPNDNNNNIIVSLNINRIENQNNN